MRVRKTAETTTVTSATDPRGSVPEAPKTSAAERTVPMFPEEVKPNEDVVQRNIAEFAVRGPEDQAPRERMPLPVESPADRKSVPTAPVTVVNNTSLSGGEYVDVTYGEETYSPFEFMFYKVGPFSARIHLLPGESFAEATRRGLDMLGQVAAEERPKKRAAFFAFLGKA